MKFALAVVIVLALTTRARAELAVAIVPGIAVNLDAARVDALSQDLASALAAELEVDARGGLEVRRRLPAEGLPPDCLTTPTCIEDVARRLGATQLVFVVMVDSTGSGAVQIDSTWVEPATGRRASRPAIDLPSIADARVRFAAAARSLLPDAPVRAKPTPSGGLRGVMSPEIPRHFTTPSLVTGGVAVVGLGLGIGFGLSARSRYDACDVPTGPCDKPQRDSIRTRSLIADLGFVLALGGAVATGVLFATSGSESRLVVGPTGDGVAASFAGRF